MTATPAVRETRQRLGGTGSIGAGLTVPATPAAQWRDAARRIERLGYTSAWPNELIGGREAFTALGLLLAATERLSACAGIANIWNRHPAAMQAGAAALAEAYPGRFGLGVGVSYPFLVEASGQTYTSPLPTLRDYLARMRGAAEQAVQPDVPFPTLVGAFGPKMLELSRDHADGAVTSNMPVSHTKFCRDLLGPDKLLVVGVFSILETDPDRARALARESPLLRIPDSPQLNAVRRLGYTGDDVAGGGSDRLIDDMFVHGTPEATAERVAGHYDAGADHVVLYGTFGQDLAGQLDQLDRLAPVLLG